MHGDKKYHSVFNWADIKEKFKKKKMKKIVKKLSKAITLSDKEIVLKNTHIEKYDVSFARRFGEFLTS